MPSGPWIVVAGMHRSGTSAIAGAVGALGFNGPRSDERIDSPWSNPDHWESHHVMLHNEALLERFGGSWDAPPDLPSGWELGPEMSSVADPAPLMAAAYPDPGPLVWKDPRVCLLAAYWRARLPSPVAVVLIWRPPLAVARSLQERDGLDLVHGAALWERYNLAALEGLRGLDVYVLDYEALLADRRATMEDVGAWLGSLEQFAGRTGTWDVDTSASIVVDGLRHQPADPDRGSLLPEQISLERRLSDLRGGHRRFDPGPPMVESPWTTDLLAHRRRALPATVRARRLQAELDGTRGELERVERILANMRASTSWRITGPLRAVVGWASSGPRRTTGSDR